jgi:hypothetical protein
LAECAVATFAVEGQRGLVKHYERVWLSLREVGSGSKLGVRMQLGVRKRGGGGEECY